MKGGLATAPTRAVVVAAALFASSASARELPPSPDGTQPSDAPREMATDRPNVTNSPTTIDPGRLQVEAGGLDTVVDRDGDDRRRAWSLGELNLRLGILPWLEANAIVDPRLVERDRVGGVTGRASGFGDTVIGGKINFWGNDGGPTALALQPQLKLPTADRRLGNGHAELDVSLPFTAGLPAGFSLSLQPTLSRRRDTDDRRYVWRYQGAAAIDHDLGPFNLYAEYVWADSDERRTREQYLDLGGTTRLTRDVVLDTGVAVGLDRGADDLEVKSGASLRF